VMTRRLLSLTSIAVTYYKFEFPEVKKSVLVMFPFVRKYLSM
jgi:hypothetical protein